MRCEESFSYLREHTSACPVYDRNYVPPLILYRTTRVPCFIVEYVNLFYLFKLFFLKKEYSRCRPKIVLPGAGVLVTEEEEEAEAEVDEILPEDSGFSTNPLSDSSRHTNNSSSSQSTTTTSSSSRRNNDTFEASDLEETDGDASYDDDADDEEEEADENEDSDWDPGEEGVGEEPPEEYETDSENEEENEESRSDEAHVGSRRSKAQNRFREIQRKGVKH